MLAYPLANPIQDYCPFVSVVHIGYGTQHQPALGSAYSPKKRCYYGVKLSDNAGWNEMNWNKMEQVERCTISKVRTGMAQEIGRAHV